MKATMKMMMNVIVDNAAADGTGGTRYAMVVQLHRQYCGDDAEAKALRYGYLTAQLNGSDQCAVSYNTGLAQGTKQLESSTASTWGSSTTTWGVGTWGGESSKNYRLQFGGTGYYIDVSISDSGNALPVFSRFQLEAFALGRR